MRKFTIVSAWWTNASADTKRFVTGLFVWGVTAVFILVPELEAAFWHRRWVTISHTIGHLEESRHILAIVVVGSIVIVAAHTFRYRLPTRKMPVTAGEGRRTPGGRLTKEPLAGTDQHPPRFRSLVLYLLATGVTVALASWYVSTRPDVAGTFWLEYTMYGLLAIFLLVIPNVFAVVYHRDVPFPTLFKTIADIEARVPPVALVLVAGLVVLVIHLGLYPWPGSLPKPSPHP